MDPASLTNSTLTYNYGAFDGNNSTVISANNLNLSGTVTVNVASRLEGLTKDVGYPLVCSGSVVERLAQRAGFVELGARDIKGHRAVEIYGWRPENRTPAGAGGEVA